MVDGSRIYRILFDSCHNYATHLRYMQVLDSCGARVQDYIIDFKHRRVKYFVTLNLEISVFMERLYSSMDGDKVLEYSTNNSRGVSEL